MTYINRAADIVLTEKERRDLYFALNGIDNWRNKQINYESRAMERVQRIRFGSTSYKN